MWRCVCSGVWLVVLSLSALACGGQGSEGGASTGEGRDESAAAPRAIGAQAEVVTPPFAVEGELKGLLLVWFDDEGSHAADQLADIPEARREHVRVDSPSVPPEQRLPPDQVYVADLREPGESGHFVVRRLPRAAFDAMVDELQAAAAPKAEEVIVYKASWCGVCKQAAAFLRERKVPFIERDVEKDPAAAAEMQRKAKAAGKSPRGVPVIDFRGHLLLGFDRNALEALIAQGPTAG